MTDYTAGTGDGHIHGRGASYSTARNTAYDHDTSSTTFRVGQYAGTTYNHVYRGYLSFDTSAIPDTATILSVSLTLTCTADLSTDANFDVNIIKQDWSGEAPIDSSNRETAYDGTLTGTEDSSIWRNTSGMSINTPYTSGELDTTWVSKTGTTYYALASNRDFDGSGTDPATGTDEYIEIASASHATTGYRPTLTVTYTTGVEISPPVAAVTIASAVPTLAAGVNIQPPVATITVATPEPNIQGTDTFPPAASITVAAAVPTIAGGASVSVPAAAITLAAAAPTITTPARPRELWREYECSVSGTVTYHQIASDDFGRADGVLGGNWTTLTGMAAPAIQYHRAEVFANGAGSAIWTANTFAADHYAQSKLMAGPNFGPAIMVRGANTRGYFLWQGNASDTVQIYRQDTAGSWTMIAETTGLTISATDTWRLDAVGSVLTGYQNGVAVITVTDATYSDGSPGIWFYYSDGSLDDFSCGDIGATVAFSSTPLIATAPDTWAEEKILEWPEPSDRSGDDYTILTGDQIDVVLDDADGGLRINDACWLGVTWTVSLYTVRHMDDDTTETVTFARKMTGTEWTREPGRITLTLADVSREELQKLYPSHLFTAGGATFPDLLDTDVGRPVPAAVGYAIKVPCTIIDDNSASGPWVYAVCEKLTGWYYAVNNVYRGGQDGGPVVSETEWDQGTYDAGDYDLITVEFAARQTDLSNAPYTIWADVTADTVSPPTTKYNAASEASRILTWAGLTPDSASWTAAALLAASNESWVDWCYARDGNQTTVQEILNRLCLILRGRLFRADDGEWEIWQDQAGTSDATYYLDSDLIEVSDYHQPPVPATVEISYQPDSADPSKLKHVLTRTISGGIGEEQYEIEMVRDFTGADRLHNYLTARRQYGKTAQAVIHDVQHALGDIITITDSEAVLWSGDKNWIITGIQRIPDGNAVGLLEYQAAVYAYTPGSEPTDGADGYGTDYSETMPLAPSAFSVTASGIETLDAGTQRSYVTLVCTPPAVNWAKIWFAVSDGTAIIEGTPSGATYVGTLRNLIPGKAYDGASGRPILLAWAENPYGVSGAAGTASVNYATVTHTATADTTTPATLSAPTAVQGTGKCINVSWTGAAETDIKEYVLYRSTSSGGTYYEVARGKFLNKADTYNAGSATLVYGATYYHKVTAVDYSGNESTRSSASTGVTLNKITGSDEVQNISATTITTGSMSCDRLSGGTIDGVTITGTTITGGTVRTASSAKRVEMTSTTNELRVYDASGNQRGSFGVNATDSRILEVGASSSCDLHGIYALVNSTSRQAIYAQNYGAGQAAAFQSQGSGYYAVTITNTNGAALNVTADDSASNAINVATGNITMNDSGKVYFGPSDSYLYRYSATVIAASADFGCDGEFYVPNQDTGSGNTVYWSAATGQLVHAISDLKAKTNIRPLKFSFEDVFKFQPIRYEKSDWLIEKEEKPIREGKRKKLDLTEEYSDDLVGMIAQDLLPLFPEAVIKYKKDDIYSIEYIRLVPVLFSLLQEVANEVKSLAKKIDNPNNSGITHE